MVFTGDNHLARRRWQRVLWQVPVELEVHQPAYADCVHASGSELNEGGMCLLAVREMRLGTQVAVEFTPPLSEESLRLWAAVRNRRGYHYGLEFLAENAADKTQIQRYRDALRILRAATHQFPAPA